MIEDIFESLLLGIAAVCAAGAIIGLLILLGPLIHAILVILLAPTH